MRARIPSMYTEFIRAEIIWHKEAHVVLYLWAANKKTCVFAARRRRVRAAVLAHRILCFIICMHIKHSDVASVGESQHNSPLIATQLSPSWCAQKKRTTRRVPKDTFQIAVQQRD